MWRNASSFSRRDEGQYRRRRRALGRAFFAKNSSTAPEGEEIHRDADVMEHAASFYEELFHAQSKVQLPRWSYKKWDRDDLAVLGGISGYRLRVLVSRMKAGKSCSRDDMMVAEMLMSLEEAELDLLCQVFQMRLDNAEPSMKADECWDLFITNLMETG